MRRLLSLTAVFLLLVPLLGALPASAQPAPQHYVGSGMAAHGVFQSYDGTGCIETAASVLAVDEQVRETGSPSGRASWVLVILSVVDICTWTPILYAQQVANLDPDAFQIDRALTTASLSASVPVQDVVSGNALTVDLAIGWEATDPPVRQVERGQAWEQGLIVNIRTDGTSRGGTAWGTVTDGTTNFTPGSGSAVLSSARALELRIDRP